MSEPTVRLSDLLQLLVKFGELPQNDFSAPILSIHPPADRARLAHLVQQRIRTLDVLCENAEKLTDKIAEIRRNLYRERAQCTTILAPISALPNELLIYIFIITSNVDRKSAPSIAHVCRRWRAIATDQPVLWRSIEVSSTLISNLTSFIKYSGEESLQLYINTGDEGEAEHSNNENVKLPEMATRDEFQRRLRSLEISGSNHLGILHPLAAAHGTLASLQSLTLCAGKTCDTMAYDLLFMELPQLDHLELHNVKVELGDLNGASVTELAFERHVSILTTHYIRNIFDRCPKLRRLTFSGMHDCFATERPHLLPSLEVLTIRNVWGNVAADFITHISAPHLKSLIIRPLEMNLQAERPGTLETLGRASDFERRDELEDARIFFEFQRLVTRSPEMTELDVSTPHDALHYLVKILTPQADDAVVRLPRLEELTLTPMDGDRVYRPHNKAQGRALGRAVEQMLARRVARGLKLRELSVSECMVTPIALLNGLAGGTDVVRRTPCNCPYPPLPPDIESEVNL